jgi:biopolymer transport protein ExbD
MEITMPEKVKKDDVQTEVNEKKVLTVILGDNDKVYWYKGITDPEIKLSDFSATGIRKILMEQNATTDKMIVLIKPAKESRYKNVVDILDEMNITNMQRYAIVKITSVDEDLVKESNL